MKTYVRTQSSIPDLIAPCGLNCRLCRAYARKKNPCPGCRVDDALKPKTRVICKIKTCERIKAGDIAFCFDCEKFPCAVLVHLDKRYRMKYSTSPIGNLASVKEIGITQFIEQENHRWTCPDCGEMLCMHEPQCLACGFVWHH